MVTSAPSPAAMRAAWVPTLRGDSEWDARLADQHVVLAEGRSAKVPAGDVQHPVGQLETLEDLLLDVPHPLVHRLGHREVALDDLRTTLKTEKYIRLNAASGDSSVERILADRGRENQERRKHLLVRLEDMLLEADVYALGQKLDINRSQLSARLDELTPEERLTLAAVVPIINKVITSDDDR